MVEGCSGCAVKRKMVEPESARNAEHAKVESLYMKKRLNIIWYRAISGDT
jgi:hypothetical protein